MAERIAEPWYFHAMSCVCTRCEIQKANTNHIDLTVPKKSLQEKMREYNKRYREKNNVNTTCECGSIVKKISLYNHLKSKKHQSTKSTETLKSDSVEQ
jgi:hypothetical protein